MDRKTAVKLYRKYLQDCLDDPNFAIEHVEDFDDWLESEKISQAG